ncbi:MAG: hypothetical protein WCI06_02340 [Methylococcaceae bacterium]
MNIRLENILTSRLEEIFHNGSCFVSHAELYYWYETKALTAKVYSDLETRFQEIDDNMKNDKSVGKNKLMKIEKTASGRDLRGIILFSERSYEYATTAAE